MIKKECFKCKKKISLDNFHKQKASKDGRSSYCKLCHKAYNVLNKKKNKQKIKEQHRVYRLKHRDKLNASRKEWGKNNPDKVARNARKHREKYRVELNKKRREKRKQNINFKLRVAISNRIRLAINRGSKNSTSYDLLGCTWEELRFHLEKQFSLGMNWDNYGKWHIDHIKPCCSFNLTDLEQQKLCFHYSNLQPLWAEDNFKKSGKLQ